MGLCFGIHILGLDPDFDTNFSTIMWDANSGPVEVSRPTFSQNFTVYSSGGKVMGVAETIPYATRIVSFSTNVNVPSDTDNIYGRTSSIGFQLRVSGVGGEYGQFYNFTDSTPETLAFSSSKGSNATSYTKSLASEARSASIVPGTRYDFFQQTWSNR